LLFSVYLSQSLQGPVADIDGFEFSDFEIDGYSPHGAIKMEMAV
jgi:thymidylate synthase